MVQQRMIKEADFAFRQAFAFCPYSPEAVFRYVNLLLALNRIDDALIVARTCQKLDPNNGQIVDLVKRLQTFDKQTGQVSQVRQTLEKMEKAVQTNPADFQAALNLASAYLQMQQTDRAEQVLDGLLNDPHADAGVAIAIAQAYAQIRDMKKLEVTLDKLVKLAPESPEAWYDLAALKATLGKAPEAFSALRRAAELSDARRAQDPKARDLVAEARNDPRFAGLKQNAGFEQALASTKAEAPK
jgi:tetratricopeptide (TPR) repeat protein